MPPHLTVTPSTPITIEIDGGETSATSTLEYWNDKEDAFVDTTTADGLLLIPLLSWDGGLYKLEGHPALDERWFRARITAYLSTPDAGVTVDETTTGATGTQPLGANSNLAIRDLAPQEGVRIELFAVAPGGRGLFDVKLAFELHNNESADPLAKHVTLASPGVVPADRIANIAALLDGGDVTADDTDTVTIARGHLVSGGAVVTFLESTETFDLADGDAVDLLTGEEYRATIAKDPTGANVITKGPKAEAVLFPAVADGNIYVESLIVHSADGVNVTVAPASLVGGRNYAAFHARAGVGLTAIISQGEALTDNLNQRQSHDVPVTLSASSVNRIWLSPNGSLSKTTSDVPPTFNALLLWYVETDGAGVIALTDARKMVHRAVTTWREELRYADVLSQLTTPAEAVAIAWLHEDAELEAVELILTDVDATWTANTVQIDVRYFPAGDPVPFPAGGTGTGGASIFTSSGTDDQRPTIAFDATVLRVVTNFHEVRRFPAGTAFVLDVIDVPAAPAAEPDQMVRVALIFRRYR